MTDRLYWPIWSWAALLTGIVAGFMLGHALILAPFLDWLLRSGIPALSQAYPGFRSSAGRSGLDAYYAVAATPDGLAHGKVPGRRLLRRRGPPVRGRADDP